MLRSLRLLPIFLSAFTTAESLKKNQLCFDACYESNGYVVYAGDDPELYYKSTCQYPPKILSIYAAATVYCTQDEIDAGIELLAEYCMEYGPDLELLPISQFAPNLTEDAIKKLPVVSYDEAVAAADPYNHSILISPSFYTSMRKTVDAWEFEMWAHHTYGFAMYGFWGALLLIGMLYNAFEVFVAKRFERYHADSESLSRPTASPASKVANAWNLFNRNLILPFTFGTHHQRKLWGCTIPTRMVSIVVAACWLLNIVLCAVGYDVFAGNLYWPESRGQVLRYLADRTGIVCFANLPIMWIFAGRNNVFLWATGWKFSTFNIFHRNVARIATIQAILHSVAYTVIYADDGIEYYYMEFAEAWFVLGVVATVLMSFILLFSVSIVRSKVYEVFLILHILMSLAVLISLFYHVSIFTTHEYDPYLWAVAGIWVFDRLLRFVRVAYCNLSLKFSGKSVHTTTATAIYDEASGVITLAVVPGSTALTPQAGQHYYLYTPRAWNGWESHPFTMGSWISPTPKLGQAIIHQGKTPLATIAADLKTDASSTSESDEAANLSTAAQPSLIFWIRAFDGFTKRLAKSCRKSSDDRASVKVLLEGPYGHHEPLHHYESVLLIAGGTGIAGVYPYLLEHLERLRNGSPTRTRTLKIIVAARQAAFFRALATQVLHLSSLESRGVQVELFATRDNKPHVLEVLEPASPVSQSSDGVASDDGMLVDKARAASEVRDEVRDAASSVRIGRPKVEAAILDFARANHAASTGEKTAVMVCGPGGMADEARAAVLEAGHEDLRVTYFEDAYGW